MAETFIIDDDFDLSPGYETNIGKDSRDIKKSLKFEQDTLGTIVYAIAVNILDSEKNRMVEISTCGGDSLNYEAHDHVRDVFHISCASYHEIGTIPISYRIRIEGTPWEQDIPLPLSVIKRYMTVDQRRRLDEWAAKYKTDHYIEYLQALSIF